MTVRKGKKRDKKSAIDNGVNFKVLGNEYAALMKFRYRFVLENLEEINFRFREDAFFHLLGFHKIKDATIVEIVDGKKVIAKDKFFRNVISGDINYDYLNLDNILNELEKERAEHKNIDLENIKTHKNTINYRNELGKIISNRWLCFSEDRILSLFGRRIVLDYDKDDYSSLIEADRVFFQFLEDKQRHVNLFVKYNSKDAVFYPVTFFLEDRKDDFLITKDGREQKKINILVKMITNIHTNEYVDIEILWSNVRKELKNEPEYIAQSDLYSVFSSYHIKSKDLVKKISAIKSIVPRIPDIYIRFEDKELALQYMEQYEKYIVAKTKEEKEDIEIFFMETEQCIDIENIETHVQFKGEYSIRALKLNKQIKRYEKMLPLLFQLEIKEVKYIYGKFLDISEWSDTFVRKLIDVYNCYDNELSIVDIEEMTLSK